MGADLYIKSEYDAIYEKLQGRYNEAVQMRDDYSKAGNETGKKRMQNEVDRLWDLIWGNEFYFRDSYNGAGLFAQLKISWWKDVIPMLDNEGFLPIDGAKKLHKMVEEARIEKPTVESLKKAHCKVDEGENSPESWLKSWEKHREQFLKFLELSIEMNEPIYCSL